MTYVNVPWQSIISDLLEYKKQQRQEQAPADSNPPDTSTSTAITSKPVAAQS
ncbi:hypothetical protein BC829DRAFT_404469 [Chytridium lagenaria]|nr:hypothetical protein BC829DRAFT_406578 [Chytridium lagenaria]KAI8838344.1 hypothetical protein BC829DRAFT_404469 [Chytridium lagenaria]